MKRWLKKTISMIVRFICALIHQRLEKDTQMYFERHNSKKKMIEEVINRLYEVPRMTNDRMHLYTNKASLYVAFKDGSVTLHRFINFLKVDSVYVFDKKGVCQFGGYVGWVHSKALENELRRLHKEFGKD